MKKKLRLDPEALRVDTFRTAEEKDGRGTVRAHGYTQPGWGSCDFTCGASPISDTEIYCAFTPDPGGDTELVCCV